MTLGGGSTNRDEAELPARPDVTIRFAYRDDAAQLAQLGELASRSLPGGVWLVAESGGRIRVAADLWGVGALADPRVATGDLLSLLRHRMYQLRGVPIAPGLADRLVRPEFPDPSWFERRRPGRRST
ncbi:MAG TPA: hypothetical protein VMF57_10640 [Solirubrobacteraceae bacterium]|nr:hypothetical protein [Solirubrobacteraceae bacterium]